MDNEVKEVEESQLQIIVKESDLPKTKADYILEQFQHYFKMAAEWEVKAKSIIVTDASQTTEMEIARVGRLFLKEQRIKVEHARKNMKADIVREGKAIDGIANVLKALIEPIEEDLKKKEKFVEIKAQEEAERLRIEEEKKAEEERIRQEKINMLHNERKSMLLPYLQWWDVELATANFGEYSEEDFKTLVSGLKQKKSDYDKKQEEIRIENEKLKIEKEKAELESKRKEEAARLEKEKLESEKRAIEEKAKQEKEEAERKAKEEQARVQKEKEEAEAKAAEERKVGEERERKLKEETDKVKAELESKKEIECPHCHKKFKI